MQAKDSLKPGDIVTPIGHYTWLLYRKPDPLSCDSDTTWHPEELAVVLEENDGALGLFVKILTNAGRVGWTQRSFFRVQT
jgi:hypothetical protein